MQAFFSVLALGKAPKAIKNMYLTEIDGANVTTLTDLYALLKVRLKFPDYFGDNLDALNDALYDLEWMEDEKLIFHIKNYDQFLAKESREDKLALLQILNENAQSMDEVGDFMKIYIDQCSTIVPDCKEAAIVVSAKKERP
jgi:RNAse (barnase) inhibitor barstar